MNGEGFIYRERESLMKYTINTEEHRKYCSNRS